MKLRIRDFIASILSLLLSHQLYIYNHASSESLSTSIELQFYTHFTSHVTILKEQLLLNHKYDIKDSNKNNIDVPIAKPVPFDIDGDGIIEALVVPSLSISSTQAKNNEHGLNNNNNSNEWIIKVLDLKPLHQNNKGGPKSQSSSSSTTTTTTQAIYPKTIFESKRRLLDDETINSRIPIKIITGQLIVKKLMDMNDTLLVKTRNGSLPSIVTIWNNGDITFHFITTTARRNDQNLNNDLELREMWRINPFGDKKGEGNDGDTSNNYNSTGIGSSTSKLIDFSEIDLILDSDAVIIVAATYYNYSALVDDHKRVIKNTLYCAIDALTGDIIWTNQSKENDDQYYIRSPTMNENEKNESVPMHHQNEESQIINHDENEVDCHKFFGNHISNPSIHALPHAYTNADDAKIVISHFNKNHHTKRRKEKSKSTIDILKDEQSKLILFHNRKGLNVLSLQNGSHVCHLSLHPNRLYADVDKDGSMDEIQVVTKNNSSDVNFTQDDQHLCHATLKATNTISPHVERFRVNLCSSLYKSYERKKKSVNPGILMKLGTSSTMPLVVESFDDKNDGKHMEDIIFALNHGSIQRYDSKGELQWSRSKPFEDIPTWHDDNDKFNGFLGRIDFKKSLKDLLFVVRPILILGDNQMTIVSAGGGRVLASITFPQPAIAKPILADVNGDGTTDVLILTNDGIWGYIVKVNGQSLIMSIAMSLLLLGFFIALVIHECGVDSRRATDDN